MAVAVAVMACPGHDESTLTEKWEARLDRINVFLSREGYTASVVRHDELEQPAKFIANRNGEKKLWRDLDTLVAYVLRNVSEEVSFYVQFGAKKCE